MNSHNKFSVQNFRKRACSAYLKCINDAKKFTKIEANIFLKTAANPNTRPQKRALAGNKIHNKYFQVNILVPLFKPEADPDTALRPTTRGLFAPRSPRLRLEISPDDRRALKHPPQFQRASARAVLPSFQDRRQAKS